MSGLTRGLGCAALAASMAIGAASLAQAADMAPDFGAAPPLQDGVGEPQDPPVVFGTGWYLRGDLGVSKDLQIKVGGVTLPKNAAFPNSWSLGIGAGYKFSPWLRADLTADWRAPRTYEGNTTAIACPMIVTNGVTVGSQPCFDWTQARMNNTTVLLNLYADLGTWAGITPYVGAGVGFNYAYQKFQQNWFLGQNGRPAIYTLTDTANGATYDFNFNRQRSWGEMQLAWALMGGVAYNVTPHLAVDVGARYVNMGKATTYTTLTGTAAVVKNEAKEVRVGFRYTPD